MKQSIIAAGCAAAIGGIAYKTVSDSKIDLPENSFAQEVPSEEYLNKNDQNLKTDEEHFQEFIAKFGKNYPTKEEYKFRFEVFKKTLNYIKHHDPKEHGSTVGINRMADWTDDEFGKISGRLHRKEDRKRPRVGTTRQTFYEYNLPHSIDWRRDGSVTSAVAQHGCGSCWAFTTVAAMESYNKIAGGALLRLSPQQLVDCASNDAWGNFGCEGGHPAWAFEYTSVYGVHQWSDYSYTQRQGQCRYSSYAVQVRTDKSYDITPHSVGQMKAALTLGPVAVTVDADSQVFRNYQGGVIRSAACYSEIGHAVLAIGYGVDAYEGEYITIKNSWGTDWGEDGFVRISTSQIYHAKGICGVLNSGDFATVINPVRSKY